MEAPRKLLPDDVGQILNRLDHIEGLVLNRLDRMERTLEKLALQKASKDWYGTAEVAELLGKAEFTVREWCRQGRIHGEKKGSGRGKYQSWVISHQELLRIQREGLLPTP